ncbi:MAG TPA: hypothetical protein DCZ71_02925, partial [Ruminococcus sp.]|nr:hypothetical protein [Ruminococcus sp.]
KAVPAATENITTTVTTTVTTTTTVPVTTLPPERSLTPVFKYFDKNLINSRITVKIPEDSSAVLNVTFDSPECTSEPYYKTDIKGGETVAFELEGYDNNDPMTDFRQYKVSVRITGGQNKGSCTFEQVFGVEDKNDHPDTFLTRNYIFAIDDKESLDMTTTEEKGNDVFVYAHLNALLKGDVNSDGMVDSNDASMVLEEYSRLSTGGDGVFGDKEKSVGDVNGDGIIDSNDASAILEYYASISTGGKPTW